MSHLLGYVFSITGFAVFALAGVVWLGMWPHAPGSRRWLTGVVLFYSLGSMPIVPWILARPLVFGFHHFNKSDVAADLTVVVLLAGGGFTVHGPSGPPISGLDRGGATRVLEAAYVYQLLGSPLVISSGGAAGRLDTEPSAVTMLRALVQLGVPSDRIVLEASSRTTRDEAVLIAPMVHAMHVNRIVLVTSDIHMRRSLAAFRAVGLDPVPAIAEDPGDYQSEIRWFIPSMQGLQFANSVVHEYVGLLYYATRGWLRFSS